MRFTSESKGLRLGLETIGEAAVRFSSTMRIGLVEVVARAVTGLPLQLTAQRPTFTTTP